MSEPARLQLVVENVGLERIKRAILEGQSRLNKTHAEWVEGSLQIGLALREGRHMMPPRQSFVDWLAANKLDFFNRNTRQALVSLTSDLQVARELLTAANTKSYILIWRTHRNRFGEKQPKLSRATRRTNTTHKSIRHTNRAMKLGEENMDAIKGTTLDNAYEIDELLILNRGVPPGELTPVVAKLIADAKAGKTVSAIAVGAQLSGRKPPALQQIVDVFWRRMAFMWQQLDPITREEFTLYLTDHLDKDGP